jgi:hypothetical protein
MQKYLEKKFFYLFRTKEEQEEKKKSPREYKLASSYSRRLLYSTPLRIRRRKKSTGFRHYYRISDWSTLIAARDHVQSILRTSIHQWSIIISKGKVFLRFHDDWERKKKCHGFVRFFLLMMLKHISLCWQ